MLESVLQTQHQAIVKDCSNMITFARFDYALAVITESIFDKRQYQIYMKLNQKHGFLWDNF